MLKNNFGIAKKINYCYNKLKQILIDTKDGIIMDKVLMNQIAEELIEKAKQLSKEKFLTFTENIYGIDREVWDHLWEVPVVPTYEYDDIFPTELSTISRDEVLDILDECIAGEIGDEEAVFIPFENIISSLSEKSEEAAREYEEGVRNGTIPEDYNAVIVYYDVLLKRNFKELVEEGNRKNPPITLDKIKEDFLNLVSETFLHERIHLNASTLMIDSKNPDFEPLINGIESESKDGETDYNADRENDNEVVIDTMAKIMQTYKKGDSIEDCLYRVIESRGGASAYKDFDDRLILSLYTLFPEEFCKWVMFEAYDEQHHNIFEEKYIEVFGEITAFRRTEMLRRVGEYFNKTAPLNMTKEQFTKRKEMLEMLGVRNINLQQAQSIDIEQLKELATSEPAMEQLAVSFQDMKVAYNEIKNPGQKEAEEIK